MGLHMLATRNTGPAGLAWIKGGWLAPAAIPGIDTTGTVDNTAAINNWLATATAGSIGTLPAGVKNIRCDGTITAAATDLTIRCDTPGATAGVYRAGSTASLSATGTKTADYTAVNNDSVVCDTTGGAFFVTLPSFPVDLAVVQVQHTGGRGTGVTIRPGAGDTIINGNIVLTLITADGTPGWATVVYSHAARHWTRMESSGWVATGVRCLVDSVVSSGGDLWGGDHPGGYAQLTDPWAIQKGVLFYGGANQFAFQNCTFIDYGGDGIAVADDSAGITAPFECVLNHVTSTHNGGNGSSCNRANYFLYNYFTTSKCGQAGLDFEPNGSDPTELPLNIEVANFSIDSYRTNISASGDDPHYTAFMNIHDGTLAGSPYVQAPNPAINNNAGSTTHAMQNWTIQRVTLGYTVGFATYSAIFIDRCANVLVDANVFTNASSGVSLVNLSNCSGNIVVSNNTLGSLSAAYHDAGGNGAITSFGNHA